jgi:hypothetical protein
MDMTGWITRRGSLQRRGAYYIYLSSDIALCHRSNSSVIFCRLKKSETFVLEEVTEDAVDDDVEAVDVIPSFSSLSLK